jgi:formyl-CoA transferase
MKGAAKPELQLIADGGQSVERALEGLIVLDLTQFAAGPYCTMLLADAGARVIKIEPPNGEPYRHEGPSLEGEDGSRTGSYFLRFNRNKESVVLDLKSTQGREAFKRLVRSSDVVVQNFKPETLERLGIDYPTLHDVNEKLVYASISGFGQRDVLPSPYWRWPAFAVVAEAMGGIMDQIGDANCPPHWSAVSLGDLYAGGLAVSGILMALIHRGRTGVGQHVDVSMMDCMVSLNERALFKYALTGVSTGRGTSASWAPFGAFRGDDGWVAIGVIGNSVWQNFCAAIDRPEFLEDPSLSTGPERVGQLDAVIAPAIHEWLIGKTSEQAAELLNERGVPAAPVHTAKEVFESEHVRARHMIVDVDYEGYGRHQVVGSPIKLSADPNPDVGKIPRLGEHTDEVLRTLAADHEDART